MKKKLLSGFLVPLLIFVFGCSNAAVSPVQEDENQTQQTMEKGHILKSAGNDHWYFRGTANGWGAESMIYDQNTGLWHITKTFSNGDYNGGPRFKIDHYANWAESYPENEKTVTPYRTYKIMFDPVTKQIDTEITAVEGVAIHFKKPTNWSDPTIYAWRKNGRKTVRLTGKWPGTKMQDENGSWYTYEFPGQSEVYIIFSDAGSSRTTSALKGKGEWWNIEGTWTDNPLYTISYASKGTTSGFVPVDTNYYQTGHAVTVPANTGSLAKPCHTFTGWSTDPGAGTIYQAGAVYTMGSSNVTLYANWTGNDYEVIFEPNGGTGTMANQIITYNTTSDLAECTFTKEGYIFAGWSTSYNGTVEYAGGERYTMRDQGTTLYALWTKADYDVVFEANGGTGTMANQTIGYGAQAVLSECTFVKDGYTFAGWALSANGPVEYKNTTNYTMSVPGVTLYAVWNKIVTFPYTLNGVVYNIKTDSPGSVYVEDCLYNESGTVVIQDTIGGFPVTAIGDNAFIGCFRLTGITIPAGVTTIGKSAFGGCYTITELTIPAGVTSIGAGAFYRCFGLTGLELPRGLTSIEESLFKNCDNLTELTIPAGVTSIGAFAFKYCKGLTSITIPKGVVAIEEGVFLGCTNLTDISIPEGVTSIGKEAFALCESIQTVTIPDSVTSIGEMAFNFCASMTSITIPDSVTVIENGLFAYCYDLTDVSISPGVTSIGQDAFLYCQSLRNFTIPAGITSINTDTFSHCKSFTAITIPEGVTSIGSRAFYGCTGLTSITMPDTVTTIKAGAFAACRGLTSITIPAGVTSIETGVFNFCYYLKKIYMKPQRAPAVVENTFAYIASCELHIRANGSGYDTAPWRVGDGPFSSVIRDL